MGNKTFLICLRGNVLYVPTGALVDSDDIYNGKYTWNHNSKRTQLEYVL